MRYNVQYSDSNGNTFHYLAINTDEETANKWCEKFNKRYRKPYLNGKGYYAPAIVVPIDDK